MLRRRSESTHTEGIAESATRSRTTRLSVWTSELAAEPSMECPRRGVLQLAASMGSSRLRLTLPQLFQKLIWRNVKRIFAQHSADNHHRVRAKNIHRHTSIETRQIVSAD